MQHEPLLILSVDDDPCVSRVVQLKLQQAGYEVVKACTAEEAFIKIQELRPDVIITDVKMPGMSGIELCKLCENSCKHDHLIIVLTSQLDEDSREWVESSPRRLFISKPFSPRKILETIELYRQGRLNACIA